MQAGFAAQWLFDPGHAASAAEMVEARKRILEAGEPAETSSSGTSAAQGCARPRALRPSQASELARPCWAIQRANAAQSSSETPRSYHQDSRDTGIGGARSRGLGARLWLDLDFSLGPVVGQCARTEKRRAQQRCREREERAYDERQVVAAG